MPTLVAPTGYWLPRAGWTADNFEEISRLIETIDGAPGLIAPAL